MQATLIALLISFAGFPGLRCDPFAGEFDNPPGTREKRWLVFPQGGQYTPSRMQFIIGIGLPMEVDVSLIIGYTMKFNYLLPTNTSYFTDPYVRYDRSIDPHFTPHRSDDDLVADSEGHVTSRWELYGMVERTLRSGKACLLRAICEAASVPFNRELGLTGQLLHTFFTPSTTTDPIRTEFDKEYHAAEEAGREGRRTCDSWFSECTQNYLEYFTDIH